jgi:peptidoglycan/xylan/chitin deacetylase (PgdA/CDA1 family)
MRAIALQYHDVIDDAAREPSGFTHGTALSYKLRESDFARHLDAIRTVADPSGVTAHALAAAARAGGVVDGAVPVLFTFDDGGRSAHARTARLLERHGWRGHFLITTDYIGAPTFLSAAEIRDLDARGHVIGAHSCSHPVRMSHCTWAELVREWSGSVRVLGDILGHPVTVASVPGGYYSRAVAEAAAAAGVRVLFTSEPTTRCARVGDCLVVGRFTLRQGSSPATAAQLAAGSPRALAGEWMLWNAKKVAKQVGGRAYLRVRKALLH